jgi:1-acyl-sn-glycerol-3-phosphate acyltransferase
LRVKKRFLFKPNAKNVFIYCVNHASYLDIPVLTYVLPGFNAFIGKSSIGKVPLFGYMFRNLHITVDRKSSKDRARALQLSESFLKQGRSLIFFPEGGIKKKKQPGLAPFKDGAFRLAMELNIPVVPVTLPFNWKILPDSNMLQPNPGTIQVVIHKPLYPSAYAEVDIEALKQDVFRIIEAELKDWNPSQYQHHGD